MTKPVKHDPEKPQMATVTVWGNHSHQGKPVEPGSQITVRKDQAARMQAAGVLDKPEGEQ